MVARFDGRNPRAEAWLRDQSSRLITEVIEEQKENVRQVLRNAMEAGGNPRDTARDVVGYYNRRTKRREGGIVGLRSDQIEAAERAFAQLRSGDPDELRAYLNRKLRDKRFDPVVNAAIRDGKPVTAEKARSMVQSYRNRLLKQRGDLIARTETLRGINAAQAEAMQQVVDSGRLQASQITRVWDSAGPDGRTRDSHLAMEGQKRGQNEPFTTPGGHRLMYPGDTSLGAPASETIQCRCVVRMEIDFFEGLS